MSGSRAPSEPPWYYRPWAVLALLFLVLGPIGLPLLWRSPHFRRASKIVLTIVVAVYTVLLLESTLAAVHRVLEQIQPT